MRGGFTAVPPPAMVRAAQSNSSHRIMRAHMHDAHALDDVVKHVAPQDLAALSQGAMKDVLTPDAVRAFSVVYTHF